MRVEWDEAKARATLKKHEVDFADEDSMRKRVVKMREEYDFSTAKRGPVIPPEAGKTRITIRAEMGSGLHIDFFGKIAA